MCALSVHLINNPRIHTQFQFFFFSFSSSFLRVELLTLVKRMGVLASYHLCKCVCVRFFLSKHSFFLLELIVISDTRTHTYIYRTNELKEENEINVCGIEFESTSYISDFIILVRLSMNL